jgi:hypothetical protein
MPACNDLRIGGTLSATGITGGTSINSYAIAVEDWSQILGTAGLSGSVQLVNNRPGGFVAGDLTPKPRFPTLALTMSEFNAAGGLTAPTGPEQKQDNTDDLFALIANPGGNYLEVDMPDNTSRFLYVYNLDAAPIRQPNKTRSIRVPLVSPYGYWKAGGNQSTDTIAGPDTMVVGGNANVWDAVLTFPAAPDTTFTHSTLGWAIQVIGASGPVTVNLGTRTVTEGGSPAENLLRHTDDYWGYFTPGNNSVTATGSVGVVWRNSWH